MDQLVTREGDLFQVSDSRGDFSPEHASSGLYSRDTRFLNRLELLVDGEKPQLMSGTAAANYVQQVFLQCGVNDPLLQHTRLSVQRRRVLYEGVLYERILITNQQAEAVTVPLQLRFGSDFADLFEVRGARRAARGEQLAAAVEPARVVLRYRGLDGLLRQTLLAFAVQPDTLSGDTAGWRLAVPARGEAVVDLAVAPAAGDELPLVQGFDAALEAMQAAYASWQQACTRFETDNPIWNRVLERSCLDLRLLMADLGQGAFPVAGVPWFAVPFGRDSLIAAAQSLSLNPDLARGTLCTLAALQGATVDAWRQEEPGKILHELRAGEMANLNEVPFGRYYGSVDSTPLFLVLLGEYYSWTGDLDLVRELMPNIRMALQWLDTYGDSDGDGFLEYRAHGGGLVVQSWKDSPDSMSHRDGRAAASPVAVAEVQGYAYDARRRLAPILAALGEAELAGRLAAEAEALRERFNSHFWMADRQFFAIALDGEKAQVGTVSSDIGHCLWSGIIHPEKAAPVAQRLVAPDMFGGWGIRTLSSLEAYYNPMSYHNGSVWPHDTALGVLGLKRYGFDAEAGRVISGLVTAASHFPEFRLPELFCGYDSEVGRPMAYPVACSPQAWAAATPFVLVQAMLGLEPDAAHGVLRLRPSLPDGVNRVKVEGLRVGGALVNLEVTRAETQVCVLQGRLDVQVERQGG